MNPKTFNWYGASQSQYLAPTIGSVFYQDGTNGLDTNPGTLEAPVLTLTYALSLCTGGANDYIFSLGNPGDGGEAAWPIDINVSKVHIIGTPTQASPSPLFDAPADTDCFTLSASNVEIAGLEMSAGATAACIASSGTIWKANIHHNWFATQGGARDGIHQEGAVDCPHWYVWRNVFGNPDVGITRDAIRVDQNMTRSFFRDNFFHVTSGGLGIHFQGLCTGNMVVLDNRFNCPDAGAGEAITLSATAIIFADGNVAGQGKVAMANNPYVDTNGTGNWGVNYQPGAIILPA